ncbi:hypothetical protein F2Q70_00030272 [Brassica cretica]|uniref:Zinc finger PHD-type domain-containing protein n=1 Tax=Brassica cretica TaxID=69181 RepID=A0A8S9FLR9_BRACR|nr:hypothetical protein F2Q70_00030272 [Brassica cretica]
MLLHQTLRTAGKPGRQVKVEEEDERSSYGEMIACDNNECKIEWFHFGCVGLKDQPKGKWYCPDCATVKKSRKGR